MANSALTVAAKNVAGADSSIAQVLDRLPTPDVNVSNLERWASLGVGGLLVLRGISGRGIHPLSLLAGGLLAYRGVSGNCQLYKALGINTAAEGAPERAAIPAGRGVRVEAVATVDKPAGEVYAAWRRFEDLPKFMQNIAEVRSEGNRSHWVAKGPLGFRVEWDAELIEDRPGQVISWRSVDGADVDTAGSVRFRELEGRKTEVRVNMKIDPPAGRVGVQAARWLGADPDEQIRNDLSRFKHLVETTGITGS